MSFTNQDILRAQQIQDPNGILAQAEVDSDSILQLFSDQGMKDLPPKVQADDFYNKLALITHLANTALEEKAMFSADLLDNIWRQLATCLHSIKWNLHAPPPNWCVSVQDTPLDHPVLHSQVDLCWELLGFAREQRYKDANRLCLELDDRLKKPMLDGMHNSILSLLERGYWMENRKAQARKREGSCSWYGSGCEETTNAAMLLKKYPWIQEHKCHGDMILFCRLAGYLLQKATWAEAYLKAILKDLVDAGVIREDVLEQDKIPISDNFPAGSVREAAVEVERHFKDAWGLEERIDEFLQNCTENDLNGVLQADVVDLIHDMRWQSDITDAMKLLLKEAVNTLYGLYGGQRVFRHPERYLWI
ncbi:hypothetical protein BS50DRAFT_582054 [Corynespora cassiicola Philippines]|uniref:Uncharacterized protein n=1 Tax=Corynespora cassiicola Philippines TaxID=1448308 RepID=A0A2T2PCJ1_CORCC|nr:hypothetical protein BS50DRAFT_582054 [Corynespora cassiicola Philippines]